MGLEVDDKTCTLYNMHEHNKYGCSLLGLILITCLIQLYVVIGLFGFSLVYGINWVRNSFDGSNWVHVYLGEALPTLK